MNHSPASGNRFRNVDAVYHFGQDEPTMSRDPIIRPVAKKGRPADRLASLFAALGLILSLAATLWFFMGFFETDPGFAPASSAFLLALGLGAFAIIPCAVVLRLSLQAWMRGFETHHGLWTLFLMLPWIGLAIVALRSNWLPLWLTVGPISIASPLCLWAIISLILDRVKGQAT